MKLLEESKMQYFSGYVVFFNEIDRENNIVNKHIPIIANELSVIWQHNVNKIIGKISGVKFDEIGIFVIGFIFEEQITQMNILLLISNNLLFFSIGYLTNNFYFQNNIKYLNNIELIEISLVTIPSQRNTIINLITKDEYSQFYQEIHNQLKERNLAIDQKLHLNLLS